MTLQQDLPRPRSVDLSARFTPDSSATLLTGVQAIARLITEQHYADKRAGKKTASFVSGYQGSPLAGVDKLLESMPKTLRATDTTFTPALNEELAATAVWGSQLELPVGEASHEGVVGYWYGKGPGFDRASDALRHANMFGVNPNGGMLLLVGDDPASKSSTVPAVSERSLAALNIPVLFPRNSAEVVELGLHGIAISRLTGCVVALKIVTDVADGASIVEPSDCSVTPKLPSLEWQGEPWKYTQRGVDLTPGHIQSAENDLFGPRTAAVLEYARLNNLNSIEANPPSAKLGLIASGSTYSALRQSLIDMGVTEEHILEAGIRVMKMSLIHPIGRADMREFAKGLEKIVVIEDKTAFIETYIRDALYGMSDAPSVLGKRDEQGSELVPHDGELTADRLSSPLRRALDGWLPLAVTQPSRIPLTLVSTQRTPYFCSGCPHNRSTVLPEGSIGGGGIGCHTMVTLEARETSSVTGITQMGGEGAQWIGQAPFTDVPHIFQNVGDGTFFHSGQLAVQACIAAGVNITYKVLFNEVVAMTGAQDAQGALRIEALTHKLTHEGVAQIIVVSEDPSQHKKRNLATGTLNWHRDRLDEAQRKLREIPGVTVLIYEQHCAADARRQRKRGTLQPRSTRVVINEAVCEGCGDCGRKSNCLSVQPFDTEFGRKTRIDQSSCNTDYSCLDGDCPSFITVEVDPDATTQAHTIAEPPSVPLPEGTRTRAQNNVFIAGIGGTGIVTVNQVLGTAAFMAGYDIETLDQTGLSQKAGPVTSHLRFSRDRLEPANRVSSASSDCVLAFDLLTATTPTNLWFLDAETTVAVASTSQTPTGDMVYDHTLSYPAQDTLLTRLGEASKRVISFDALEAANTLFGNTENANFLIVGAAFQSGALDLPAEYIEEAVTLNGVSVDANIAAFRWGRVAVADPTRFAEATAPRAPIPTATPKHVFDLEGIPAETARIANLRAQELVAFQRLSVAADYLGVVRDTAHAERRLTQSVLDADPDGADTRFSEAVATYLYKLTAYKDEYEVARLLTQTDDTKRALADVPQGKKPTFRLHPPMLRALGRKKKIGFTPATHGTLRIMSRMKGLRGTPFDPFGYGMVRKVERTLVTHYREMVRDLCANLTLENYERAVRLVSLPDMVRGYEEVKLGNVRGYCELLSAEGIDVSDIEAVMGRSVGGHEPVIAATS